MIRNCPKRESCPDENTERCETCKLDKPEPVKVGTKEAIEYFKEENERYENMLGDKAKLLIEHRVTVLAIEALEEKLLRVEYLK